MGNGVPGGCGLEIRPAAVRALVVRLNLADPQRAEPGRDGVAGRPEKVIADEAKGGSAAQDVLIGPMLGFSQASSSKVKTTEGNEKVLFLS